MPPKAANAQSSQAALKTLELDDMLAEAHAMMGMLRASEFDWKAAECEFLRALELDPKSEDGWSWYDFYYLVPMRRLDEAVAASRRAVELDPLSPFLQWRLAYRYNLTRQWDRVIAQCRNVLDLDPNDWLGYLSLGTSYAWAGRLDEAIRTLQTCVQLTGGSPYSLAALAGTYALAGRIGQSQKVLEELQALAQKAYVSAWSFGVIFADLGEIDICFDWLEKAVDERDPMILHIHLERAFDPLRSHPRYPALLRKMNLEP